MKKAIYVLLVMLLSGLTTMAQSSKETSGINISKLVAYEKGERFYIDWATDGKVATNTWEVQSSVDGKKFKTIGLVLGADPGKTGDEYQYRGKIADQKSAVYYRVVHHNEGGGSQASEIIKTMKLESVSFINTEIRYKKPAAL